MRSRFVSTFVFAFLLFVAAGLCHAQPTTPSATTNLPAPMNWNTEQDHRNMMEQLGIKRLRPGADGMNPQVPDYQNTDEAKANPYPNLPDPAHAEKRGKGRYAGDVVEAAAPGNRRRF